MQFSKVSTIYTYPQASPANGFNACHPLLLLGRLTNFSPPPPPQIIAVATLAITAYAVPNRRDLCTDAGVPSGTCEYGGAYDVCVQRGEAVCADKCLLNENLSECTIETQECNNEVQVSSPT